MYDDSYRNLTPKPGLLPIDWQPLLNFILIIFLVTLLSSYFIRTYLFQLRAVFIWLITVSILFDDFFNYFIINFFVMYLFLILFFLSSHLFYMVVIYIPKDLSAPSYTTIVLELLLPTRSFLHPILFFSFYVFSFFLHDSYISVLLLSISYSSILILIRFWQFSL